VGVAELKTHTRQCCEEAISFRSHESASIGFSERLASTISGIRRKLDEALRDFPNNTKSSDEYWTFLIECAMDLRAEMIELGHSFVVDYAFGSLVRLVLAYLERGILNISGQLIGAAHLGQGHATT
jgi:hypothetical protein